MKLDENSLCLYGYDLRPFDFITSILYRNGVECDTLDLSMYKDVYEIPKGMFSGTANIKKVILPPNLEVINEIAFARCTKLKEVVFPDSLNAIKKSAFRECSLESFIAPKSLSVIGMSAFHGNNLKEIHLNENLHSIGNFAFQGNKLKYIFLPKNLDESVNFTTFMEQKTIGYPTIFASSYFNKYNKEDFKVHKINVEENNLDNIIKCAGFKDTNKILKNENLDR